MIDINAQNFPHHRFQALSVAAGIVGRAAIADGNV